MSWIQFVGLGWEGGGVGGGGGWRAKGGFFHTFEWKSIAIMCSLKCTNSHSLFVRLIRLLAEV